MRWLFFDLDDTLWNFTENSSTALRKLYEQSPILKKLFKDIEEFIHIYHINNKLMWDFYAQGKVNTKELKVERWRRTLATRQFEVLTAVCEELDTNYLDILAEGEAMIKGVEEMLEYVTRQALVAVLSNGFSKTQYKKLRYSGLDKYVTRTIVSEEIGINKPNPALFRYAVEETGASEPFIMIGDNAETDILGAMRAGWYAIWYNPKGEAFPLNKEEMKEEGINPELYLGSVNEMEELREKLEGVREVENRKILMEKGYKEALDFLFSQLPMFSRTGAPAYKPGLDTSINLSRYFGDPHKKFKAIHVGGTNGKGSTSHMITSVLQEQGYKVGLYTSPHLVDFRERMRINGEMIQEGKVVEFVKEWRKSGYEGHPSFFELTMIMAFNWFAEEKVDYAVIEVGMGGRLDSTNIITPILSIITNISHDHNQFLGDTLAEIAGEKAGIIKKGIPVVIGETMEETEKVFKDKAREVGTEILFADQVKDERVSELERKIDMPLHGDYQKKNLRTVLVALEELKRLGVKISEMSEIKGIEKVGENTGLAGRWMIMEGEDGKGELVIADTGHNIAGLSYNFRQLARLMEERGKEESGGNSPKLRVVIGFVADKAIDKILKLLPKEAEYYITNAQIPRALAGEKLMEKMESAGLKGRVFKDVGSAYEGAKREASERDIIFIGGSTFIVADFLHYRRACDGRDS